MQISKTDFEYLIPFKPQNSNLNGSRIACNQLYGDRLVDFDPFTMWCGFTSSTTR